MTAINAIRDFLKLESAGGLALFAAAALALIVANSPLEPLLSLLEDVPVAVQVGALEINKPLYLWVDDGLMAVFFFLIGLELKREILEGELSEASQIALPAFAALGGFLVPAGIYVWFNWDDPVAIKGWAIPAATDIAFALGILALLGSRVPLSLKVFLTSLAIFDDVGAILVIAVFYTEDLSLLSLGLAGMGVVALVLLNLRNVGRVAAYVLVGIFIWICVLKSGIHATLAGVITGLAIPLNHPDEAYEGSPLRHLEHSLHGWVAFLILPVFAFMNAGVSFADMSTEYLLGPVQLGIEVGLFVGKQGGVFLFGGLAIALGIAQLPRGVTWGAFYGVALLSGVGFTMSLFISALAFQDAGPEFETQTKAGVLIGSLLSGLAGYLVLRFTLPKQQPEELL